MPQLRYETRTAPEGQPVTTVSAIAVPLPPLAFAVEPGHYFLSAMVGILLPGGSTRVRVQAFVDDAPAGLMADAQLTAIGRATLPVVGVVHVRRGSVELRWFRVSGAGTLTATDRAATLVRLDGDLLDVLALLAVAAPQGFAS